MSEVGVRANLLLEEAAQGVREEIVAALRELSLSGYAANVLFALARVPQANAGDLILRTTIPDSKIYYALRELVEAGLVEVQEGKPKTYRMVPGPEMESRLHGLLASQLERQRATVTRVASLLEPLRSGARSPTMDLAYVVKGQENVIARANGMIASAKREILLLASEPAFVGRIEPGLSRAVGRGVRVKLAVPEMDLDSNLAKGAEVRSILCQCRILIVDQQQILTVSDTGRGDAYAITSTDDTLVRLGLEYWDSPRCCTA